MSETINIPGLGLTQTELQNIDRFRKQKNTAVLTIMFTDIQGFTALTEEKGESYVHNLHSQHDEILVETIQENNAGVVIKFIGDSIMAVFSEPTAAVEKSLLIQKRLHEFNAAHKDLEDIKVRIGLHMGQTVIENKMQVDLFGRHVNRASRIEGLADGGHVFISYSVFDSVKTWLIDNESMGFKFHGNYSLKGIKKPEEIYEVYNKGITKPKAPAKGKSPSIKPAYFLLSGGIVVVCALILFIFLYIQGVSKKSAEKNPTLEPAAEQDKIQPEKTSVATGPASVKDSPKTEAKAAPTAEAVTEIFFTNFYPEEPVLDLTQSLASRSVNGDKKLMEILNDIPAGNHVIHYAVARGVRYFAAIAIKPGKNILEPKFIRSDLAFAETNLILGSEQSKSADQTGKSDYFYYTLPKLSRIDVSAQAFVEIKAQKASEELTAFDYTYKLTIDGKTAAESSVRIESPMGKTERTYFDEKVIYEDAGTKYKLAGSYVNNIMNLEIYGVFKDQ